MIEFKCGNCQKKWYTNDYDSDVKYCTFCGKEVTKKIEKPDTFNGIAEVLAYLIQIDGREVLENHGKIIGFVSDYLPNMKLEKNILRQLLSSNAYRFIIESGTDSLDISKEKAIRVLVDEYGLSPKWAEQSIQWVVESLYVRNYEKTHYDGNKCDYKDVNNSIIRDNDSLSDIIQLKQSYVRKTKVASKCIAASKSFAAVLDQGIISVIHSNSNSLSNIGFEKSENSFTKISAGDKYLFALTDQGKVQIVDINIKKRGREPYDNWNEIIDIAAGNNFIIGLKRNSTLLATGEGLFFYQLGSWKDICKIEAGGFHLLGLRNDGKVYAAGKNSIGQCSVDDWTDIVDISAGEMHSVGLKKDGTVVAVGWNHESHPRFKSRCAVESWSNIIAISAGEDHTLGLRIDGTVIATGNNKYGQCDVNQLKDIIAIKAGFGYSIFLDQNKKIHTIGKSF